jgi:hypothetical protein
MKYLLLLTLLLSASSFADDWKDKTVIVIGAGWIFHEDKTYYNGRLVDDPLSARISIEYRYSKRIKFGISHHSQWLTGFPTNNDKEVFKTELFIDFSFSINDLIN